VIVAGAAVAGWLVLGRKQEMPSVATSAGGVATPAPPAASVPPHVVLSVPAPGTAVEQAPAAEPPPVVDRVPPPASGTTAATAPPPRTATAPPRPATETARTAPAEAPPRADASAYVFLDEEAPAQDGRDAGERLAGTYRQGGGTSGGGTFGASGRFRARERSPRVLAPMERPAVATIRHLIDRMEAFHRKEGRYAGLADLRAAGLALDVPVSGNTFQRRGFRFEVTVESDGFRIEATPLTPAGRSFVGDDSGYIRAGLE
jgi:hypothetical protein